MTTTFTYDHGTSRKLATGASYPTTFMYDYAPTSIKIVHAYGCRTNMTYDNSGLPIRKVGEEAQADEPTIQAKQAE